MPGIDAFAGEKDILLLWLNRAVRAVLRNQFPYQDLRRCRRGEKKNVTSGVLHYVN